MSTQKCVFRYDVDTNRIIGQHFGPIREYRNYTQRDYMGLAYLSESPWAAPDYTYRLDGWLMCLSSTIIEVGQGVTIVDNIRSDDPITDFCSYHIMATHLCQLDDLIEDVVNESDDEL